MTLSRWALRCTPGLSLVALLIFLECTLAIIRSGFAKLRNPAADISFSGNSVLLWLFIVYSVFLHLLSLNFPLRVCLTTWTATKKIKETHAEVTHNDVSVGTPMTEEKQGMLEHDADDVAVEERAQIIMAIIIPTYKEDASTMEDTLSVLASHPSAKLNYHIFIAMEERDPNATSAAQHLLDTFSHRFLLIQHTMHPAGIPGEAPGKSSNVSWAAREVEHYYYGRPEWKNVLITIMDSDTHLLPQYFECVRVAHHRNRRSGYAADMSLYMPPIIFDRNAHLVPRLVRIADLIWCAAGLSCFLSDSTVSGIAIPTSVYTVPLALVNLANGWDTGPSAIGEDMHMMLKCYFATNGHMRIESIPSPASQCNISTDKRGIRGWFMCHNARYKQSLRHMWGSLDTGYALENWLQMGRERSPSSSPTKGPSGMSQEAIPRTGRPRKLSHTELTLRLSQLALHGTEAKKLTYRNFVLFSRLFEAHFLPAHLVLVMIASTIFAPTFNPSSADRSLSWVKFLLDVTGYIRIASYITLASYFLIVYERYHHVCVSMREVEMRKAGLIPPLPSKILERSSFDSGRTLSSTDLSDQVSRRGLRNLLYFAPDCFAFPIAGTIYGTITLMQACFSHFWTEELVYFVSAKPVRMLLSKEAQGQDNEASPGDAESKV